MKNLLWLSLLLFFGCRSNFQVGSLSTKETRVAKSGDVKMNLSQGIAERYKKVKSPSFALVGGFYSLPVDKPYGASAVVETYSYQLHVEMSGKDRDFAILPMEGEDAVAKAHAFNTLLDAGVNIKELSMSDAVALAKAEKSAQKNQAIFSPGKTLLPTTDYLMSIDKAQSKEGPLLIGRVIKSDGTLLAFRAVDHGQVDILIISLFEDTISRIGK